MKRIILALVAVLGASPAYGHDLWLQREDQDFVLYYGHRYSHHEGPETIEYRPDMVRRASCFDTVGVETRLVLPEAYPLRFRCAGAAVVYVFTSSGYWTKTPYGTLNVPKTQAKQPIHSWLSYEGVKRIDAWAQRLAQPLTEDLELVPLHNPLAVGKGDKLRLQVTLEGEPVVGAIVSYDGKPRGVTGKDGQISVRLRHWGYQLIQASLTRSVDSKETDQLILTTNLNFDIGLAP